MQNTKDTFFRVLQARLAVVNPLRTVVLDGVARPAILVAENQPFPLPKLFFQCFYIHWLGAPVVRGFTRTQVPRYELLAQIEYFVQGAASSQRPFADRGRLMAAMDAELLSILFPGVTEKMDHSMVPPVPLGSAIHWRWTPDFRTSADGDGSVLRRIAPVTLSFYPEMA
jgi:hypothetical protein